LVDVASGLDGPPAVACPEGPLAAHARDAGLRVFPVPERRLELRGTLRDRVAAPWRLAGLGAEVREIVTALRPEVVYGWGARAALASLAGVAGVRPPPRLIFQANDLLKGPWVSRGVREAARLADRVVAPSETIASDIDPRGVLGRRLLVIRQGVDLERFRPVGSSRSQPHALVLGALVGWKRPRLALEAAALALRDLPSLRVTVAGAPLGELGRGVAASLVRRAGLPDLNGRVTVMNAHPDAAATLRSATCLLHCADCEPYGMVLVEALASGLPVVAPAACGPAEIVNPSCGRLYTPGDARAAADALIEVLSDPTRTAELGAAGRRRAEALFDVEETQRRHRELVEELAAEPGARPAAKAPPASPGRAPMALATVTHNSERDLRALLDSVERHLPEARVIVADSGSGDASVEVARGGRATVIELGENAGFARGCNSALAQVLEPVTVLVNPDVELLDGSLAALARELTRPGTSERILAPLVMLPDGSRQDSAQRRPAGLGALAAALLPPASLPRPLARRLDPWRSERPRRVGWAVGCCLAARTDTLRGLGPFDERIFLFAEDLELGLRAADAGVETWFWPEARVLHRGGHSTGRAFGGEPFELLARNRRAVIAERLGEGRARLDDWLQLATFANRMALKTLLGRGGTRERAQLQAQLVVLGERTRPS
jgi:GT2 family glycosyltransferase/glycosyltransferase involved in cell wall biosynthesis